MKRRTAIVCVLFVLLSFSGRVCADTVSVRDMAGREIVLSTPPERIVCLAPGTLRLIVYLGATASLVGVEEIEKRFPLSRPYWIANNELASLPSVGPGGPGAINTEPDLEAVLAVAPDLIFITYMEKQNADRLQEKLGIPVVVLSYGPFGRFDETVFESLDVAGKILGRERRAAEVAAYVRSCREDLLARVDGVPEAAKPGVYIGGIGFKGTQGIGSTEPAYAPFDWVRANNVASASGRKEHLFLDREKLLAMDPDIIFIDGGGKGQVVGDIRKNRAFYRGLTAFRDGKVFTLHSYNWYMTNIGTAVSDAYAIGKILYPEQFSDLDPETKADEIYAFLVGKPVYGHMKKINGPLGQKLAL